MNATEITAQKNMHKEKILILATGGTFDKVYFDALSDYRIGDPQATRILEQARVNFDYHVETLIQKDSLDISDDDRQRIREWVEASQARRLVITHGTDTMVETAKALGEQPGKTIVITGAMQPARFKDTDADFNLGFALGAAQSLAPGVYIAMQGQVFTPGEVIKNRQAGRFESK